jgi:hypothetical protein
MVVAVVSHTRGDKERERGIVIRQKIAIGR